jgi:hypothetical protein
MGTANQPRGKRHRHGYDPKVKPATQPTAGSTAPVQLTSQAFEKEAPPARLSPASEAPGAEKEAPRTLASRSSAPLNGVEDLVRVLRELFIEDRAYSARPDAVRCGICYLVLPRDQMIYREDDGFYLCPTCAEALGGQHIPMVRRQRRS